MTKFYIRFSMNQIKKRGSLFAQLATTPGRSCSLKSFKYNVWSASKFVGEQKRSLHTGSSEDPAVFPVEL